MPLVRKPSSPPLADGAAPDSDLRTLDGDGRLIHVRQTHDMKALGEALNSEADPRLREAILTRLVLIATPEAAGAIARRLDSDDASLRTAVLDALRAFPEGAAGCLPDLLGHPDPDVRLLACELVRECADEGMTDRLCALLDAEPQPNVCAAAIDVLAEVGGADAIPALHRCAGRFADEPFLTFSVKVAVDRIGAQSSDRLA